MLLRRVRDVSTIFFAELTLANIHKKQHLARNDIATHKAPRRTNLNSWYHSHISNITHFKDVKRMSHTIPQLQSIFSRIIAIGRKDGRISLYGAGNGELSIGRKEG